MQISTSSAIYRSYTWWLERSPSKLAHELNNGRTLTLCSLFWIVMLRAPAARFVRLVGNWPAWLQAVFAFEVPTWGAFLLVLPLGVETSSLLEAVVAGHVVLLVAALLLGLGLALGLAVVALYEYAHKRVPAWVELAPAWVRARKQRVCPLVTFDNKRQVEEGG